MGRDCFWFCSHVKCHLEFDKIWRSNPLWKLHWTAHFLILFSCYNRALLGDPCHCVIKTNYFPRELLLALLSGGQNNWQPPYTIKLIIPHYWPRICTQRNSWYHFVMTSFFFCFFFFKKHKAFVFFDSNYVCDCSLIQPPQKWNAAFSPTFKVFQSFKNVRKYDFPPFRWLLHQVLYQISALFTSDFFTF